MIKNNASFDFEENSSYQERIVAFIDILGFRSLVKGTLDSNEVKQENLNTLISALEIIKNEFEVLKENSELPFSFVITYFSDSIVLSITEEYSSGILPIFEVLKIIQIKLLNSNILLRGGIVRGKIIHTTDFILGPAMIDAYDLESKSAVYPRIVIDPEVMEMMARENEFSSGLFNIKDFEHQKTFELDFDGTYYINYFSDVNNYLEDGDEKKYFSNLRKIIRAGIQRVDIGLRLKYLWMLQKFNSGKPSYIKEMTYKE